MEKRSHLRVPSSIRFRYQIIEMPLKSPMKEGILLDLSGGGASFLANDLVVGDFLKVEIYVPDYHKSLAEKPVVGRPLATLAKVVRVWQQKEGSAVAVKFINTYTKYERDLIEYSVRKSRMLKLNPNKGSLEF